MYVEEEEVRREGREETGIKKLSRKMVSESMKGTRTNRNEKESRRSRMREENKEEEAQEQRVEKHCYVGNFVYGKCVLWWVGGGGGRPEKA